MRCFVFAGRTVARPYWWMFSSDAACYVPTIPTKDGKNIKSAVIRIICVICVPSQNSELINLIMKKETIKFIIQTLLAILSAIATSLGVTSCIGGF